MADVSKVVLNERTARNLPVGERILVIAGANTPSFCSSVDVDIHRAQ
jgi:hypothetical protein